MTSLNQELPTLYVEGSDDVHTLRQLLARHDINLDKDTGPVLINPAHGNTQLLTAMPLRVRASTAKPVGFVLDADDSLANRWQAIKYQLDPFDLPLPIEPPQSGIIGTSRDGLYRVGVWLMHDHATAAGALEDLVRTLVPSDDALFPHAQAATSRAIALGAKLKDRAKSKAELHCWLAWQEEPGRPFGQAIKAHYFRHDSPQALAFVDWFKTLYADALRPETRDEA